MQEEDEGKNKGKKGDLIFPKRLQVSYKNKAVACHTDQVKNIQDPVKGYFEPYLGIEQLMDPEKYVDTGVNLSKM